MFTSLLRRVTFATLGLALALTAAARPVVRVQDPRGVGVHSVGETMFAEVEGRTWFFKRDAPNQVLHHGNFEGEALAVRILTRLGFPVPQSRLVSIEGKEGAWFQTEMVNAAFTGDVGIQSLHESAGKEGELDPREVRLLTLADIAMGNGDRHRQNMLVGTDRMGRLRVIPIDQNLSFSSPSITVNFFNTHFVPGFDGVDPGAAGFGHLQGRNYAGGSGALQWFYKRNNASRHHLRGRKDPGRVQDLVAGANYLAATLDDTYLDRILTELPDDAFTRVPAAERKPEIRRVFRWRRDGLKRAVRDQLSVIGDVSKDARGRWIQLPAGLRQRLGLSEQEQRLAMAQLEVGPANAGLTALHLVLLELGVDKLLSRETVLALAQPPAEGEAPFGVKQLMVAERTAGRAPSSIEVATFGDYRKTQARFGALYRDRVPERPVGLRRCFLLVSQGGRRHLLDARGRRLPRPEAQGLAPWVAALDEVVAPQAGDRVLFERDVFADVPGQKAYRVGVRNGDAYRFTGTLGFPVSAGGAD